MIRLLNSSSVNAPPSEGAAHCPGSGNNGDADGWSACALAYKEKAGDRANPDRANAHDPANAPESWS
ncbi:MAG: hypothetical protein IPK13_08220 [Deltaproteobacteria bacterium]|nr:hypothetical protein [Deltaproteobacteria bacterium]